MLEDPSFFVALSFTVFCLTVYVSQGKKIRHSITKAIQLRLDPLHKAEKQYHELSTTWQQARHRIENVNRDVQDIHQHYKEMLEQSLIKVQHREETWMKLREQDIKSFRLFQQKQAQDGALQTVINEFIHEPL